MGKSYMVKHIQRKGKWIVGMQEYLSGLFTSKYGDEFYMHFLCPLCGDQVNVLKKLDYANEATIDFEKDVAGRMTNDMRRMLSEHYAKECGSDRARREKTAEILMDKFMDRVYR